MRRSPALERNAPPDALNVTKRDVAERELASAVRLFFEFRDVVSAHVLASAALEIVSAVAVARGLTPMREGWMSSVKPEFHKSLKNTLDEDYNFFKHGKRDAETVNSLYHPGLTELTLLFLVEDFVQTFEDLPFEAVVFRAWAIARHPGMMSNPAAEALEVAKQMFPRALDELDIGEACKVGMQVLDDALASDAYRVFEEQRRRKASGASEPSLP